MNKTRRFDEIGATQVIHRREPGAIESAFIASLSLGVSVMLLWLVAFLLQWLELGTWRLAIAAAVLVAALPFLFLAWGKSALLRSTLEADIYRVSRWQIDLDGDGRTGEAEITGDDTPAIGQPPEHEVIRVVPVHQVNAPAETTIRLPDDRELGAAKVRDFAVGVGTIGLSLSAWKERGWTRLEWETARDLLALHNLATERAEGQAGTLLATPGQCMRAFGL